ncbi:MAG: HlyD family secretion protein [Acidobacteria bacterium]|nr:HlyD family secretion protein [Acidobacteriota bacterium]
MANVQFEEEIERIETKVSAKAEAPRRNTRLLGGLLAGALITAAVAIAAWLHFQGRISTDNAQVDGHIVPVASKIYGTVEQVMVNDNQMVKKGQVLVRIDNRDNQARLNQAQAAVELARSQAQGATAGVPLVRDTTRGTTSEAEAALAVAQAELARAQVEYQRASTADVAAAQAGVATAQAQSDRAQADLSRMRPLVDKEEISKLQFDAYTAAARVAESQLQAAREQLAAARQAADTKKAAVASAQARVLQTQAGIATSRAAQRQVTVRAAEASSAAAGIEQARANLETAELQLGYTVIVAPVDGMVTRKNVEPGQIVQAGQPLLSVVPLNDLWVTANFKETQLAGVKLGQKAEVKIDLDGRKYEGHLDSIAAATGARLSLLPPENATGNFVKVVQRVPVKILFDNLPADALLRPGLNVDATIITR